MQASHALPVFTPEEQQKVHNLLALKVARMMGRKMEEDDWTSAYCAAKGFVNSGWSNLDIDVTAGNLGIEHKMLQVSSKEMTELGGTSKMHPALTRSIRIDDVNAPAEDVKNSVLNQYAELLEARKNKIEQQNTTGLPVELRTGWLLWQSSLRQFLYFEELATAPDPSDFTAVWNERDAGGARKSSKNLWIYEKATQKKRYSVTTSAGIKIQPYFDIPASFDPNLYIFTVIGEHLTLQDTRIWLTPETAKMLKQSAGSLAPADVMALIERASLSAQMAQATANSVTIEECAIPVAISHETYALLSEAFPGNNDDHSVSLMLAHLETLSTD